MFNEVLFYSTKAILKYLLNRRPGYQTVYSLDIDFYHYTGLFIPFYALGYSHLVTFLQSIPDTINVNLLTFEVQSVIEFHPSVQTSRFSYNGNQNPLQCCNVKQTPMAFWYQSRVLPWTQQSYNSYEPKQRSFRPIAIKKPDAIIKSSEPFPLSPRSHGDGKCSSLDSTKATDELEFNVQMKIKQNPTVTAASAEPSMLSNYCNDSVTMRCESNLVATKLENLKISNVDRNSDTKFVHHPSVQIENQVIKFKDLEKDNELDLSAVSIDTSKKSLISSVNAELKFVECSSVSTEVKFDDDSVPPPYSEKADTHIEPLSNRNDSYDYDTHYYLSSPEEEDFGPFEKSLQNSAIPFMLTEDEEPIYMLNSRFFDESYGWKYKTTSIDNVVKVDGFYELYISEVNNPYKFWFQLDEENPNSIDKLQEQLNMYYNMSTCNDSLDSIKKEHIKKGYACGALYDNVWHRGEIQGLEKDGYVKIFFVDYGTVDQVRIDDIRYLLKSFCDIPKLSYRGTLDFIKPINCRWDVETTTFFISLVENKKLTAGVTKIDCKTNSARLYLLDRVNNVNINYQLVFRGMAFPEDPRDRYQPHIADVQPSFNSLERGEYPSLAELINLLQHEYDYEKVLQSSIVDDFDCIIPQHSDDKEILAFVEDFRTKKEEAKALAKQRDAKTFLQFFGGFLKNPFMNGTSGSDEGSTTNPFFMTNPFLD